MDATEELAVICAACLVELFGSAHSVLVLAAFCRAGGGGVNESSNTV